MLTGTDKGPGSRYPASTHRARLLHVLLGLRERMGGRLCAGDGSGPVKVGDGCLRADHLQLGQGSLAEPLGGEMEMEEKVSLSLG